MAIEPNPGVRVASRIAEWVTKGSRWIKDLWQRSIQLRVISATLALSVVVVGLIGATMLRQISEGLINAKEESAVNEAVSGINDMQSALDGLDVDSLNGIRTDISRLVGDRASSVTIVGEDPLYLVALIDDEGFTYTLPFEVDATSIPSELRDFVTDDERIAWTYASIPERALDGPDESPAVGETAEGESGDESTVPALVVGAQVVDPNGDKYGFYYLFPMTDTQQAIDVVTTAVASAGILLVALLGALAWLVTRQVVTPVRMAARIAGRFSAGELSERMAVRGKDDMAKLATSFNHMAASLQHQIGKLEELSRVQQQFVSDVSHELRTPITTVRMAADVLYETKDDFEPSVQRSIELLQTQLDRFEALLTDLLEISRFDAGAAVLNAEAHDMRDLVHDVAEAAGPLAGRKGTEIIVEAPDEPCVTEFDHRRIERVLRNLVVNAVEHGEGRDVVVRVGVNDNAVAVTVRDYGVGLKPGESSLVFHRFWRADPARARTTGGTGLGLSISLEDARLHAGWLQAWGEPGEGSQFRLTLPRDAGAELTSSPLPLIPNDSVMSREQQSTVGDPYQHVTTDGTIPEPEVSSHG